MKQEMNAKEIASALGIVKRTVLRRAEREQWSYMNGDNREWRYEIARLPADIQARMIEKYDLPPAVINQLSPELVLKASEEALSNRDRRAAAWTEETALDVKVIRDKRVTRWARIVQEAVQVPAGWKKRPWIEAVATKHDTTFQSVYRQMGRYRRQGLAGFQHKKPTQRLSPRAWSPEAVDFWVGLCLKREHRKLNKKSLYRILFGEAIKREWRIGEYSSALWWFRERVSPQLLAIQRGGARALDNSLPPVLRSYADLEPFEILVGDQHRFDFWVTDDETGEVFRPEGYFWQDLRTRCFYGGALDRKYDAYLMGLALRMGMKIFGPFGSIYTDHGKPEESKYIIGIKGTMREFGLFAERTLDARADLEGMDDEEINPCTLLPGTHTKAIVRNAKAKMIERTFKSLEEIIRNQFRVPGNVKILGASQEENEIDQNEIARLGEKGKLLTFREFALTVFKAMDYYNSEKPHRGVRREWTWGAPPPQAAPTDALRAAHSNGWHPVYLSEEAVDLIFLPQATRVVDRGRINFRNSRYEHDGLIELDKKSVDLRFDPMDPGWILAFHQGRFICRAEPVEYSSMKDKDLASRKIAEKQRLRAEYTRRYRELTSQIPDFRTYSQVPAAEKAAALVNTAKRKQIGEQNALVRRRTPEELEAEVKKLEAGGERLEARPAAKGMAGRPAYFLTDLDRYKWIVKHELRQEELLEEDQVFKAAYEGRMGEAERERWAVVKELGNQQ